MVDGDVDERLIKGAQLDLDGQAGWCNKGTTHPVVRPKEMRERNKLVSEMCSTRQALGCLWFSVLERRVELVKLTNGERHAAASPVRAVWAYMQ
jgi:hypothetical protein